MSTSLFAVEVAATHEGTIDLACRPLGDAGRCVTRSFAFLVLVELDRLESGGASWRKAVASVARDELDADFFRANAGRFVARTELLEADGERYRLRVRLAEGVRFTARPGLAIETTAYDVWWDDPENPLEPEQREARRIELERWLAARARSEPDVAGAFARALDVLVAKGLVELAPGGKAKLVARLARIDADDELALLHEVLDVLSKSKWVEELYGSDEELVSELRRALER